MDGANTRIVSRVSLENQALARRRLRRSALLAGTATVALAAGLSAASAQNVTVQNGTTYTVTSNPTVIDSLNIEPGGTVDLLNHQLYVTDNGVDTTYSGTINGVVNDGQLFKTGTGTVTFSSLTMSEGELHIDAGKAVQADTVNTLKYLAIGSDGGTGTFDISGGTLHIQGNLLPASPALQVGDFGGVGVVNQTGGDVTISGSFNVGNQGGNGTYNLNGGSLTLSDGLYAIGRSTTATRNSTGSLNISGGLLEVTDGNFVIGGRDAGGAASATHGTVTQTGGIFQVDGTGGATNLFLGGYNTSEYNLNGGILAIGGNALQGLYNNVNGTYAFNLGGGTIKVINAALTTSVNATLVANATSTIDTNGLGATWSGILSGSGGLAKAGIGTLTLTGVNTYSGTTYVNGGTLALAAAGTIANSSVDVGSGGTFDISTGSKTIQDLSGEAGGIVNLGASTLTAGTGNDTTFAGVMQGTGGFTKQGGGSITLAGQNTYTGATVINNGALKMGIGDAFAPSTSLTVANNARLDLNGQGTQHVNGPVVVNGGIISLDLSQGDNILASGAVSGAGGKVDVHGGTGGFDPNAAYAFLTGSSAAGTFGVVGNDMPLLAVSSSLDAPNDRFILTFAKSGQTMAFLSETANEAAVGGALDSKLLTDPLYSQLATLNKDDLLKALDQLAGDFHASTKSAMAESAQYIAEAVGDRLDSPARLASSAPLAYADDDTAAGLAGTAKSGGPSAWVQGYGHAVTMDDASGNAGDLDAQHWGVVGGLDYSNEGWTAGIGGAYNAASLSSDSRNANGDVSSVSALGYIGGDLGMLRLRAGGSYSFNSVSTTRDVMLPTPQTLSADYDARVAQAFGEVGAKVGVFTPFVGANYINVATDAFSETGGTAALSSAADSQSVTYATAGVRVQADMGGMLALRGMAGWRHAFGDVTPVSNLAIEGVGFTATGVPIAEDAFVAEFGVDAHINANTTVGVSYTGQIGEDAQDHGAKATAVVHF
jgi:autotransporter-associated beta strand protein